MCKTLAFSCWNLKQKSRLLTVAVKKLEKDQLVPYYKTDWAAKWLAPVITRPRHSVETTGRDRKLDVTAHRVLRQLCLFAFFFFKTDQEIKYDWKTRHYCVDLSILDT